MKKQPDFRQLFYDYFGSKPKKVTYSIRNDSNRYHDLIFLKSLIHDARFKHKDFSMRGKRCTIKLNRDCWELGLIEHKESSELHIADSQLSLSPVYNLEWRFQDKSLINQNDELWIHDVLIERESHEILTIVLVGDDWSLHMKASDNDFNMKIRDIEVPYLYSEIKKTEQKH
jgi:hypothetical protein